MEEAALLRMARAISHYTIASVLLENIQTYRIISCSSVHQAPLMDP